MSTQYNVRRDRILLLQGKRVAVFNVANKRSIAWAIALSLDAHGAELILGCQNERMRKNVDDLLSELSKPPRLLLECDVTSDQDLEQSAKAIQTDLGCIDGLVHCLAFAPREALEQPFIQTEREDFHTALDISAYSLVALARIMQPLLNQDASILALSYYGAEKVIPNYNVMGVAKAALEASVRYLAYDLGPKSIRVNAISAGPINTLAARGISGFVDMLDLHKERAPLKRNVEASEVGQTVAFFCSPLSTGITGEVIHVDSGYHIMGI